MFQWEDPKGPSELKDYVFDWTKDLGADTIQSCSAAFVDGYSAGLSIVDDTDFVGVYSKVWLSGGTAGETARIRGTVFTDGGRTFDEVGILVVAEPSDPATLPLSQLQADLVALKSARISLLTGGQIKEVWREGRRIVYNVASVGDINDAIAEYAELIAAATAPANTPRKFRALRVRF